MVNFRINGANVNQSILNKQGKFFEKLLFYQGIIIKVKFNKKQTFNLAKFILLTNHPFLSKGFSEELL